MLVSQALPQKKYVAALAHSSTPEFRKKRDTAIARIREWAASPQINRRYPPAIWFSYGKDSMTTLILCSMADVDVTALYIENGGDLPQHQIVFDEFDRFLDYRKIVYETEYRYIDYLAIAKDWGRMNGVKTKDGKDIDFWDLGSMMDVVYWEVSDQFVGEYSNFEDDALYFSGKRGAEAMDRFYKFKSHGPFFREGDNNYHTFSGNPIYDWRDIDVWAFLISVNCPVSPIYSYHAIPQKGGKQQFPRTYWYPEPVLMNGIYYRWLAHYAPAQLKEMLEFFPEIGSRLQNPG